MAMLSGPRSNSLAMRMETKFTPDQRAMKYLKRVAALTGASQVHGDCYCLKVGRKNFLVGNKFVRLISRRCKSTCFAVASDPDMPSAEVVAPALLQLKSNARLFKKWKKQPGYTFKANGRMFRDAYRLTRDEA